MQTLTVYWKGLPRIQDANKDSKTTSVINLKTALERLVMSTMVEGVKCNSYPNLYLSLQPFPFCSKMICQSPQGIMLPSSF